MKDKSDKIAAAFRKNFTEDYLTFLLNAESREEFIERKSCRMCRLMGENKGASWEACTLKTTRGCHRPNE